jgi:glycosyltransferase involved in cell wall biosynthesis
MRKKRILFIDISDEFGGGEVYLDNLVQLLDDYGELYALCSLPAVSDRLKRHKIRVLHFPLMGGLLKAPRFILAALVLPAILFWHRIETIHINGSAESLLLPVARLCGRRAISTRHLTLDMEAKHWWQAPGRFAGRFLYRACGKFANRIVCVSELVGHDVRMIANPSKVVVIPNWLPRLPDVSGISPNETELRVLCVSRLIQYKGIQLVIEAMRDLPNVHLTIVGDGTYRAALEELAKGASVSFKGFQPDSAPFYKLADVFVHPTLGPEGSSLVTLEAMSHGLPCLISDISVNREIGANGECVLMFGRGSVEELRMQLRRLIEDKDLRRKYAAAGLAHVKNRHSPGAVLEPYLRVFDLNL